MTRTRMTRPNGTIRSVSSRWMVALLLLAVLTSGLPVGSGLVGVTPADAQRRVVPRAKSEILFSFAPIVRQATPAVVNVFVKGRVNAPSPFAGDPFLERFFGDQFGMPRERVQNSLGSGVVVSSTGLVVTNTHVIKISGSSEIRVVLSDSREFSAKVIVQDEKSDIAILQIEGLEERLSYLEFADSDALEVGDLVLAIGNPFGVGQTVTSGIVSGLARSQIGRSENQVFIQTDAAINPGNSGGALIDMNGKLVGINTAIYSRSGGSHGIGFAIPANLVRLYVDSATSGRALERIWVGARLEEVGRDAAASLGLERAVGALVAGLTKGGPADRAGLRTGDVIIAVDGREVADPRGARYRLTTIGTGGTAELTVMRDGRRVAVRLRLEAIPRPSRDDVQELSGDHPLDGARVADIGPYIADEFDLDEGAGVLVLGVGRRGYAARLGFRPRDVLVEVNGRKVAAIADLVEALRRPGRYWEIAILRGRQVLRLRIPA